MDIFSPLSGLQAIRTASSQSAGVDILKAQIELIKKSDPLSESQRAVRTRLLTEKQDNGTRSSALSTLVSKLKDLQTKAAELKNKGPFEGFDVKVSDSQYLTATTKPGTTPVGDYDFTVSQLADSTAGKQLVYSINGQEFTSSSNTVTDAGGVSGLSVNFLKVTPNAPPPSWTTSVSGYGQSNNKINVGTTSGLTTGDAVKFSKSFGGLDSSQSYYTDVVSGSEVRLYDSAENAKAGGSKGRIELTGNGGDVSVSDVTLTKQPVLSPTGGVTVTVGRSVEQAKTAVKEFFNGVNDVFGFLDTVTAENGALSGEKSVKSLASGLRGSLLGGFSSIGDALKTKGNTNTVSLDTDKLAELLEKSFDKVKSWFTGDGVASAVDSFISRLTADGSGSLSSRITSLDKSTTKLTKQLDEINEEAEVKRQSLLDTFDKIAKSLTSVNKQQQFLAERFSAQEKATSENNPLTKARELAKSTLTQQTSTSFSATQTNVANLFGTAI